MTGKIGVQSIVLCLRRSIIVVDLTESVTPSNINVIRVIFAVGFIFHGSFIMERDIFEVDIVPYGILFVHDFNFFVVFAVLKVILRISYPQTIFLLDLILVTLDLVFL